MKQESIPPLFHYNIPHFIYKSNKRTNINYIKFQTFFSERPKSKNSTLSSENTN